VAEPLIDYFCFVMSSDTSAFNLSLLQHDYKQNKRVADRPTMFKVNQVRKQLKQQKLREVQKLLQQQEELHRDIYATITKAMRTKKVQSTLLIAI
jgi:hypothetical protein